MKFSVTTRNLFTIKSPAIVLFAFENERWTGPAALNRLTRHLAEREFSGKPKQVVLLHTGGNLPAERVVLAGLGHRERCTPEVVRRTTGQVIKTLRNAGVTRAVFQVRRVQDLAAIVDAAILTGYQFTKFKDNTNQPTAPSTVTLVLPPGADLRKANALLRETQVTGESANFAREIANLPGNVVYPAVLADFARRLAREVGIRCTVLDKPALERGKFGGILAVGAGSARDPRLIVLEYKPARPKNRRPIALIGKAMTFDSGGISIKPADRMDEMKFDKCGGVAVLGALRAIALLKLPVHVLGIIPSAENMPSAGSYRPGDILTSYRGKDKRAVTIEVLNTDAEGRVILGDALVYARERGAETLVDLATLTGACVVALGDLAAGLFTNNDALQEQLRAAGDRTGERVWPLPLWEDYREKIQSPVADHQNTGGRYGGAITAAAFLEKYAAETPWAHIDIAGTGATTRELPYLEKGATGFGVRLLVDWLQHRR